MALDASGGGTPTRGQAISSAASRVRADIFFAVVDVVVVVMAYTLGLALRMLDPLVGDVSDFWLDLAAVLPVIVTIHIAANILVGAYGHVWEHASTSEASKVVIANLSASGLVLGLSLYVRTFSAVIVPFSVLVIGGMVSLFFMGMVRFRSRLFSFRKLSGTSTRVLVVGTGKEAADFARMAPSLEEERIVVGFLRDDQEPRRSDRVLAGRPILGCVNDIADIVEEHEIDEVVVAGGSSARARSVVDLCLDVDVRLRLLPGTAQVMQSGVAAVDARDIKVEDLLSRQQIETDLTAVGSLLKGKRVLITGAGGSIGSEIVKQVLRFDPSRVYALDRDETLLHEAKLRWLGETQVELADIRDAGRILRLFERARPHVVFHAAALKHVPVLEDAPEEAVLTNVIGTRNVIEAGSRNGMEHFVLISTDKAVDPASVMGASKRIAETLAQLGTLRHDGCVYSAVRFGNVLGSRGSVIPTFVEQIQAGGPVTVTDPDMTRFFMTVNEAVQLVLQASALAKGSEVFLLDMGEPVKIQDLARRLIRLAGLSPDKDISIEFTGRRPGEKLSEILSLDPLQPTSHSKVLEVRLDRPLGHIFMDAVTKLELAASSGERETVLDLLNQMTDAHLLATDSELILDEETSSATVQWS